MQHVKATTEKLFLTCFINFIPAAAPTIYVIIPNEFGINTMFSILI